MKTLLRLFLQGLLYLAPIAGTVYVLYTAFGFLDGLVPTPYPGLGLLLSVVAITVVGFLGQYLLRLPLVGLVDDTLERLPLIKLIYSSIKDVMKSFTGQKKGFKNPVLLHLNPATPVYRIGFVTDEDLTDLISGDAAHLVAVYVPHSFAISGQLYVVDPSVLKPVRSGGTDVMKYILAGGITGSGDDHDPEEPTVSEPTSAS